MDHSIGQRLIKGFGANLYGQAVTVVIQLAGVPILLHYWGTQLYGEWLILFAIPAYLSMTDLGFSMSAANDMTARVACGDRNGALAVFQSLGALLFGAAALGLSLTVALIVLLPLGDWVHFSALSITDVRWVLGLLTAEILIKLIEGAGHAGFRSNGEFALHTSIYYSTLFVQFVCVWLFAAVGYGPVMAAVAFLVVRALVTPSVLWLLVRRHPWLQLGLTHIRLTQLRELGHPALANVAMPLAQALNVQGMILVVGATLGPLAVVVFSTLRTLTRVAVRMVTSVSEATEPELALVWGTGKSSLLARLYVHSLRAGLWLGLSAVVGLFLFGGWILAIWTHGRVAMDTSLFYWLLATAFANVLWNGSVTLLKAANRHLRAALWYVITSGMAVALAAVLLHINGRLADAGLALLLIDTFMAVYSLHAAGSLANISVAATLRQMANPRPVLNLLIRGKHVH